MARVLFVTSRLPWPPREGHQLRSWHLLRAAAREHEVSLLSLRRSEDADEAAPELREAVHELATVPLPPLMAPAAALGMLARSLRQRQPLLVARYVGDRLRTLFSERARRAELVHLDMLPLAALSDAVPDAVPIVLNEHNVESRLLRKQAAIQSQAWRRALMRQQVGPLERFEREACRRADAVLACSAPDAGRLRELAPGSRVEVVPNGVDLEFFNAPAERDEDDDALVFVGGMGWLPNRDGVDWFLADILPRIRARGPARLSIIGRKDGLEVPASLREAVHCTGFVDDLRPLVHRASVYVVPLRAGSGTRLKILEAMAMRKAIVSTRIGAEGIALVDGEHALLADTPEAFADAVCRLQRDAPLRRRLGDAARALVEREYGWDRIGDRLLGVYRDLLSSSVSSRRSA